MKKNILIIVVAFIIMVGLSGCGGNVDHVTIPPYSSEIYTDAEIEKAIDEVISYFRKNFNDCTLIELTYAGDEQNEDLEAIKTRHHASHAIKLISTFEVGQSGGDGSLNPNSTYSRWQWILVKTPSGQWQHVAHGY